MIKRDTYSERNFVIRHVEPQYLHRRVLPITSISKSFNVIIEDVIIYGVCGSEGNKVRLDVNSSL